MNVKGLLGSRGKGTGDARHHCRSARLLLALGGALVLVLGVAYTRTATFRSTLSAVEPTREAVVPEGAAELRIATISHEDPGSDSCRSDSILEISRVCTTDERVAIRDYEQAVRFYRHLISNSDLGERT